MALLPPCANWTQPAQPSPLAQKERDMPDYSPRIISKINETPALLSLLYDANLLPEQINSEREYTCLQAVVMAYSAGEQAANGATHD